MHADSRFDADKVVCLASITQSARFEIQLTDARGTRHVISLPLPAAVELGCLICDASESAPYLVGGIHRKRSK